MDLQPLELEGLFKKYKDKFDFIASIPKPLFKSMVSAIDTEMPEYFSWVSMVSSDTDEADFIALMNQAALEEHDGIILDPSRLKLTCTALKQQFKLEKEHQVAITDQINAIQEKHAKSISLADHNLSFLDLKRFVLQTNMVGTIGVFENASESITHHIHNARINNENLVEGPKDHTIGMIINLAELPEQKLANVVIHITQVPLKAKVDITTNEALTPLEDETIKKLVADGLSKLPESTVPSSPIFIGQEITTIEYTANTLQLEQDINVGLLLDLYRHDSLEDKVSANVNARDFKFNAGTLREIRQSIINQQIRNISVGYGLAKLSKHANANHLVVHPKVLESIQNFKLTDEQVIFPEHPDPTISHIDYLSFLLQLNQKVLQLGIENKLNKLTFDCSDFKALEGIATLKFQLSQLNVTEINLTLSETPNAESQSTFLFNLKMALISLSELNVDKLNLPEQLGSLSDAELSDLTFFIQDKQISVDINLGGLNAKTTWQGQIDAATSEARLIKNAKSYEAEDKPALTTDIERKVRSRPVLNKMKASIDVELQQEVQVEVAVEASREMSAANDTADDEVTLYDLDKFKTDLRDGAFSKASKSYLLPTYDGAEALWRNWFGCFDTETSYDNLAISKEAIEELMRHQQSFNYGIGFLGKSGKYENLPQGFSIQKQGEKAFLHFDKMQKKLESKAPLSADTKDPAGKPLASFGQIDTWNKKHATHPFKTIWQTTIESEPYNKQKVTALRAAFPLLAHLPADTAASLIKFAQDTDGLNIERLQFLTEDIGAAKAIPLGRSQLGLKKELRRLFDNPDDIELFIRDYEEPKPTLESHILNDILSDESIKDLRELQTHIDPINFGDILELTLNSGEQALKDLLTVFEKAAGNKELLQSLNSHVLSKTGGYQQLLTEEFNSTLSSINVLPKNEKDFFTKLLYEHAKHNPTINITSLFESYKYFKNNLNKLAEPGQEFELPEAAEFIDMKSMPVALARMLAIVSNTESQNRQAQINVLHKLDLSSTGAVQCVMRDFGRTKWHFLTEGMNLSKTHESVQNRNRHVYAAKDRWKSILQVPHEKISEAFLRFAALQKPNGSMPLSLYTTVDEKLKSAEWDDEEVTRAFYTIIAGSSTSPDNVKFLSSPEQATAAFEQLYKKIARPSTPLGVPLGSSLTNTIRRNLLESLINLDNQPPLPMLTKLVTLISNGLSKCQFAKLDQANDDLRRMASSHAYGIKVYQGMMHYTDNDYRSSELFFDHLKTILKIDNELSLNEDMPNATFLIAGNFLVKLISTFHLNADTNLDEVITNFKEMDASLESYQKGKLFQTLHVLTHISEQKYPSLTSMQYKDLLKIINTVTALDANASDKDMIDAIREIDIKGIKLEAYFDPRYLAHYGKREIPSDVERQIETNFSEALRDNVRDILMNFTAPSDTGHYHSVVDKLISITQDLSPVQQALFLQRLNRSNGLFLSSEPLESDENTFMKLLEIIDGDKSNIDNTINFLTSNQTLFTSLETEEEISKFYKGEEQSHKGLDKKTLAFLNEINPYIRMTKDLSLSELEILPRVHDWILRTPENQIDSVSAVERPEFLPLDKMAEACSSFQDTFKPDSPSQKLNFNELKMAIEEFELSSVSNDQTEIDSMKSSIDENQAPAQVSMKDGLLIANNQPTIQLARYLTDSLSSHEKQKFEDTHKEFISRNIARHPELAQNESLVKVLFHLDNLLHLKNVTQGKSLEALKSPKLLEDDGVFNNFLMGLEQDVISLKQLKNKVTVLQENLHAHKESLKTYSSATQFLLEKTSKLVSENALAHAEILKLLDTQTQHYNPETGGEFMLAKHQLVDKLQAVFEKIPNKNTVLSLCMHFNGEESLQVEDLTALIDSISNVEGEQALLFDVAVKILNNDKGYVLNSSDTEYDFDKICKLTTGEPGKLFLRTLSQAYQTPPYPSVTQVLDDHKEALKIAGINQDDIEVPDQAQQLYKDTIAEQLKAFDISPCHRELDVNGFKIEKAVSQVALMKGYHVAREKLVNFEAKTAQMREKSSTELLDILKKYRPDSHAHADIMLDGAIDYETLTAVSAELFYRSKGVDKYTSSGDIKLGSSMEINTTQYLAILSSLETTGHVTSEIGTGEGKSRIMMISNVCQWALGNTVDFVTSDVQLATRDYVEYQAFFDMVGAETSMIFAHSNASNYKVGGINFSDPSHLSLFRNKAKSQGKGTEVIDPNPEKRSLMLDEADKTFFDVADTRFNYSKESDASLKDMAWAYELLMAYFEQETVAVVDLNIDKTGSISPLALFYKNVDASRESFLNFAGTKVPQNMLNRLKSLSEQQIEQWQVSAVTASQLELNQDFIIVPDQLISTPKGPQIASEAQLLFGNRVAKGSKFSFGVHQCLHARLNRLKQNTDSITEPALKDSLSSCVTDFYSEDEKQIVYSSTSKNLIDDYKDGTLKGVTGTAGSKILRAEASMLYEDMKFIDVPRAKGMKRIDKGINLQSDNKAQLKAIIKAVTKAREQNQPILLIAKNDAESKVLYEDLLKHFPDEIQRIHSELDSKEEKRRTDIAGIPHMITVSTDMIGRGTDIGLKQKTLGDGSFVSAQDHGLNVITTYLPKPRDLQQIIGRSGRFGAEGQSELIIDKKKLLKELNRDRLPRGYIKNMSQIIETEQAKMDRNSQVERLLKNHIGDFRMALAKNFYDDVIANSPKEKRQALVNIFVQFFEKSDKAWNETWPNIQAELQDINITPQRVEAIDQHLSSYQTEVQKEWTSAVSKVRATETQCSIAGESKEASSVLKAEVPPLKLDTNTRKLMTGFKVKKKPPVSGNHLFKMLLAGVLGVLAAGAMIGLLATGILAPLAIGAVASICIAGGAGVIGGAIIGSVVDHATKPEPLEEVEVNFEGAEHDLPEGNTSLPTEGAEHDLEVNTSLTEGTEESEVAATNITALR